jgi:hypothetical protein
MRNILKGVGRHLVDLSFQIKRFKFLAVKDFCDVVGEINVQRLKATLFPPKGRGSSSVACDYFYRSDSDHGPWSHDRVARGVMVSSREHLNSYPWSLFDIHSILSGFGGPLLSPALFLHLPENLRELRVIISQLFLAHQPRVSLGFLGKQNRFLRSVSRFLSYIRLPSAYASSDESENDEQHLRPENLALNRRLLVFIFPVLYLLSVAGCIVTISLGGQEDDPPTPPSGDWSCLRSLSSSANGVFLNS